LSPNLAKLLAIINEKTNSNFNGILVNQYENGNNSIGAHSDDESGLGTNGVVGISYGAERKFRIRSKTEKGIYKDIIMKNGMVIHMGGEFQKEFTHEIPVEKRVNEERISFTFRYHSE
jgi:alkylated DNA repair dioxygenase AlkB